MTSKVGRPDDAAVQPRCLVADRPQIGTNGTSRASVFGGDRVMTQGGRSNRRALGCSENHHKNNNLDGAAEGIRTPDPRITNAMLYQLSYRGPPKA